MTNRRSVLKWLSGALGTASAALIAIPGGRFVAGAMRSQRRDKASMQRVARLQDLVPGRPTQVAVIGNRRDAWTLHPDEVVGRVATVVGKARDRNVPVVWVRHHEDEMPIGSDGWQIVPELVPGAGEPIVEWLHNPAWSPVVTTLGATNTLRLYCGATFFGLITLIIWFSFLAAKIDGVVGWSWANTMIPIFVFVAGALILALFTLVCALVNPLAARKQDPDNLFTEAVEVDLDFTPEQPSATAGFADSIKRLFSRQAKAETGNDARFSDVQDAVQIIATQVQSLGDQFTAGLTTINNQLAEFKTQADERDKAFNTLKHGLETTPAFSARPPATGGDGTADIKTDC